MTENSTLALLASCGVPATVWERLRDGLAGRETAGFVYPWAGLEDLVVHWPNDGLPLIGYGSLMNPASAARTIKDVPSVDHPPVLAAGARRIFHYAMSAGYMTVYGRPHEPREVAALNMMHTGSADDVFNGRLLYVSGSDIPALREREGGYDLKPVVCLPWGDWTGAVVRGFILTVSTAGADGRSLIDNTALPFPPYARVVRAGAGAVSEDFLRLYLRTTFLGDGKTDIATWEKERPLNASDAV